MAKACAMCEKPLPKGRRKYCSDKCANRREQIRRYGLTDDDHRVLRGDGRCPICGRRVRRWNVDHDHATNLVRGEVCGNCNKRVLTTITTVDKARALLVYLENPPAQNLPGEPRIVTEKISTKKGKKRYWR
jgi:hypothetical protein